jgi:hypothetical protein
MAAPRFRLRRLKWMKSQLEQNSLPIPIELEQEIFYREAHREVLLKKSKLSIQRDKSFSLQRTPISKMTVNEIARWLGLPPPPPLAQRKAYE